jgi:ABC-type amino acid transport substrate-binding protein
MAFASTRIKWILAIPIYWPNCSAPSNPQPHILRAQHKKVGLFLLLIVLYANVIMNNNITFAEALTILTVEEPPSSYLDANGEPAGFSVDMVREIQDRINNSDAIQFVPETRALKTALGSPNVVLFSFSRTQERENQFHWIMLLIRKPWAMYSKKGQVWWSVRCETAL